MRSDWNTWNGHVALNEDPARCNWKYDPSTSTISLRNRISSNVCFGTILAMDPVEGSAFNIQHLRQVLNVER